MNDFPKVFISYASEDRHRFVEGFAKRLREEAVDAWVAFWEILPGDSLVGKIFDEGLKPSDAVIVVLSNVSILKPWVRKELNTAVVKNIEDRKRLILVRLDDCDIPECVRDMYYLSIHDLDNYDSEFDRIVGTIYGRSETPPLGTRQHYTAPEVLKLDDLCRNDSIVLAEACRVALEQDHPTILDSDVLIAKLAQKGMSRQTIEDSLQVLDNHYYIKILSGPGYVFDIRVDGFRLFAEAGGVPDYSQKMTNIARVLVEQVLDNGGQVTNVLVESELKLPPMLVEHILQRFKDIGQIKYETEVGGRLFMYVYWVSPELRRKLEGNV